MNPSVFSTVEMAPRDPILGLTEAFNADTRTTKVNLGVGVYYDDAGKLPLLRAVRAAEEARMKNAPPRGYQPIEGAPAYNKAVQDLLFGQGAALTADGRVVTAQALGGTGALKIGADFLKRLLPQAKVYISDPSWENHRALFEAAGFEVDVYPYFDADTRGVRFDAMIAHLKALPASQIVLLHACCHNPTGADLTDAQWAEVVEVCKARNLVPFLDMAYQGFADGIDQDAVAVRQFVQSGLSFVISSSFSKSFSLYGERVGALSIVTASKDESARVLSQLKRTIRTNYSNPPTFGGPGRGHRARHARELRSMWEEELAGMRERIKRHAYVALVAASCRPAAWRAT
jgi:aromatic-amino-acid transaminase